MTSTSTPAAGTADACAATALTRDQNADFVDTVEDVDFPLVDGRPEDGVTVVAKLAKNMATLLKREVKTTFEPRGHFVVFALHNRDLAPVDLTMDFTQSSGASLHDRDGLVAAATVDGNEVGVVARVKLEPTYALKFKIACATKHLRPLHAGMRRATGPGARPRSATKTPAARKGPAATPAPPSTDRRRSGPAMPSTGPRRSARATTRPRAAAAPVDVASLYAGLE